MGIFSSDSPKGLPPKIEETLAQMLIPTERIEHTFQVFRDYLVFTDKRVIFVDIKGLTGAQGEFHFIPHKNITHFSAETGGITDLGGDLRVWVASGAAPIQKKFDTGTNLKLVLNTLASYVLK